MAYSEHTADPTVVGQVNKLVDYYNGLGNNQNRQTADDYGRFKAKAPSNNR